MSNKIAIVGSANTDMVVRTTTLPRPGETQLGGQFFMTAGGKGANQAVAAARLGGEVCFLGKLGNDIFGQQTKQGLLKEGIQTDELLLVDDIASGVALIMVNEEGENCIAVAPGANGRVSVEDIERSMQMAEAGMVLAQLEIPLETVMAAKRVTSSRGQRMVLNPAPAQQLNDDLLQGLFLIIPNEHEASLLTGVEVHDAVSAAEAAGFLRSKGVEQVIITLGKKGCYFQSASVEHSVKAPVVQAIDTTAAGDVFSGAITVAITEGMSWEKALEFAVTAASISVTRLGAQVSIPYRSEVDLFLSGQYK